MAVLESDEGRGSAAVLMVREQQSVVGIITRGKDRARKTLADLIRLRHGLKSEIPSLGEVMEI